MKLKTVGLSPKAVLAAILPSLGGLIALAVQWGITGEFDKAELITAISAVSASLLAFLGAWAGSPGQVIPVPASPVVPPGESGQSVIGVLLGILLAALVYFLCVALGLPVIVAIVAAILVLIAFAFGAPF